MDPIKQDILRYCYEHRRLVTLSELEGVAPVRVIGRERIYELVARHLLEPLQNSRTRITEKGILEVEQNLPSFCTKRETRDR